MSKKNPFVVSAMTKPGWLAAVTLLLILAFLSFSGLFFNNTAGSTTNFSDKAGNASAFKQDFPEKPADWMFVRDKVYYSQWTPVCNITGEYYKQPDFYWPFKLENSQAPAAFGYGAYPSETITTAKPGDELEFCTFVTAADSVYNGQGMQVLPVFPSYIVLQGNPFPGKEGTREISQGYNATDNIIVTSIEPRNFLLGKTWPEYEANWTVKVRLKIKISENTKPGKYAIGVNLVAPNATLAEQYAAAYWPRYAPAGTFGIGRPFYVLGLDVQ